MVAFSDHLARATLQARFFRSRRVRTSVGRMHLLEAEGHGRLPPLVLLHGLSSTGSHYLPLVGHVRPHVRRLVYVGRAMRRVRVVGWTVSMVVADERREPRARTVTP